MRWGMNDLRGEGKRMDCLFADEGAAAHLLLLAGLEGLGTSAVEDLQPAGNLGAHAVVHVSLGALDVIVEVVAECDQQVDGLDEVSLGKVLLKDNCTSSNNQT